MAASNNQCTINSVADIEIIMGKFTPICQRYTDVMAHKYYLQHLLFNGTKLNNATVIIQLTLVVIKLQVMANSLQTAQVCVYPYIILIHINKHVLVVDGERWYYLFKVHTISIHSDLLYSRLQYRHAH